MNITKSRRSIVLCALVSVLGAAACADAPMEEDLAPASEASESTSETAALQVDPNKIAIRDVNASGAGCPRGSWTSSLSSDGLALTLTFAKYFLEATPSKPTVQSLACNITLGLDMPRGYTVGVTKVSYSGYANLQRGVTAEQIANYAWTGVGTVEGRQFTTKLAGPIDEDYVWTDDVVTRGVGIQFAPCDIRSSLQIRSRLTLNNPQRANGYFNTAAIDVEQGTTLVINFGRKSC
jgi:hypothetical protein